MYKPIPLKIQFKRVEVITCEMKKAINAIMKKIGSDSNTASFKSFTETLLNTK